MQAYIYGQSALEYYRANRFPGTTPDESPAHLELKDAARTISDMKSVRLYGLNIPEPSPDTPLHLLVPSKQHRGSSPKVSAHVLSQTLPEGSFIEGNEYVSISSPEFLFLQMARELSLSELVALGMELCGTYRLACEEYPTRFDCMVLTNRMKLALYIRRADGLPGVKRARLALQHIAEESASPMETVVYLLLCLPRRLGGYAFPQPILNSEIKFTASGKKFTVRRSSYPDLCWQSKKVDLEYQGGEHEKADRRAEDIMRRKALERMGYIVLELSYAEVTNIDLFHANVRKLAKLLGIRLRSSGEGNFREREKALRSILLDSSADRLLESENNYWLRSFDSQKSLREIAESYGFTELPSEYDSWEAFFGFDLNDAD